MTFFFPGSHRGINSAKWPFIMKFISSVAGSDLNFDEVNMFWNWMSSYEFWIFDVHLRGIVRLSQRSTPLSEPSSCTMCGDWSCSFLVVGVYQLGEYALSMMTSPPAGEYLVHALLSLQLYSSYNFDSWFLWYSIWLGIFPLWWIYSCEEFQTICSTCLLTWWPSPCCSSVCPSWPGVPAWELLN